MNKKTIITALLALITLAGQAQVKSSLDLCLRAEATGEWLIGLFDDYAIYDCEYWEYVDIRKDKLVLMCDGRRMDVQMKRKGQAVRNVVIDGVKHRTSVLTSKSLPDYPSKDETAWPSGLPAEEDSVTLRFCVNTNREKAEFETFIHRLFNDKQVKELTSVDAHGRFEVRMPVNGSAVMGIFSDSQHPLEHTFWRLLAVEGGDTLLLYVDDKNDRTYVMGGRYAQFNNELIGCDFHPDFVRTDELTIDSTIVQQRHYMAVCKERMDSLYAARPNLSRRFRTYYQDDIQYQFAYPMLLKCCWPAAGESQSELLQKTEAELNPLQWMHSELPLMCRYGFGTGIKYYVSALTDIRQTRLTDPSDFILQLYQNGKVQLSDDELQKVKSFQALRANYNGDVDLNDAFRSDIIPILSKPLIAQYWDWEQSDKNIPLTISVLNSLDMDEATREILKTHTFMQNVDGASHVASPLVMELAHREIHHPLLIQTIDNANQRIADFLESQRKQTVAAPGEGTPASRRVSDEELAGITDGQQLFEHIIKPFSRGMSSMWMYGEHGVALVVLRWRMCPP